MALLPLADEAADLLLASIPEERRSESWWLVLRDGTPVAGNHGGGVTLLEEIRYNNIDLTNLCIRDYLHRKVYRYAI
ncbi:MAG: hypothetical protein FVQ83_13615 [Chloroflexi bacterium]|nr:hypothetical protein [Chloroflexota bacterium]